MLFAESEQAAAAAAGWLTAAGAGGATVLLAFGLRWLLWTHLPAKDKQLADLIKSQDERIKEKEDKHEAQLGKLIAAQDARVKEKDDAQDRRLREKDDFLAGLIREKDEQIKAMLLTKNTQLQSLIAAQEGQAKVMHEQNQRALDQVIKHCKDEMAITNELVQRDLGSLGELLAELTSELRERPSRRRPPHPAADEPK